MRRSEEATARRAKMIERVKYLGLRLDHIRSA
jgi:hypothetical protein